MSATQIHTVLMALNTLFAGAAYARDAADDANHTTCDSALPLVIGKLDTTLSTLFEENRVTLIQSQHPDVYLNNLATALESYLEEQGPIAADDADAATIAEGFQQLRASLNSVAPQPAAAFANPRIYVSINTARMRAFAAIDALFALPVDPSPID